MRLSFYCAREGCRKRVTPPSVRFLGPKVYLGVVVILVSALRQGPTPRAARELSQRFDADRRTIARWQVFWREQFPCCSGFSTSAFSHGSSCATTPNRMLYYYWMDREFGLMHVKIGTWFPFTVQVYVNGHEWLARKLARRGIKFQKISRGRPGNGKPLA